MTDRNNNVVKMASHSACNLVLLLCVTFSINLVALAQKNDTAIMNRLASMLSPTPQGWNTSYYCTWPGIACDNSSRVSAIDLAYRSLSGSLPSEFNSLSNLISLSLQNNNLSGTLPTFANLKYLKFIYLDSNEFSSLPDGAFAGLSSLLRLSLSNNSKLSSWTFPTQLVQSPALEQFNASTTNMGGSIPDIFSSLRALRDLDLSYNHLSGPLPHSLTRTSIQYLWVHNQSVGLSGSLDVIADMGSLRLAWLQANKFTGFIPELTGGIVLYDLRMGNNMLRGIVPTSMMSLPNLAYVFLQNNELQGPVPAFKKNVSVTLGGANGNSFCKDTPGPCDQQVTTLLQVEGDLGYPMELVEAWKGNNACEQWRFVRCDSSKKVTSIDFAGQGFQGSISPALENLTSLVELHLNNNNLTGTIPESLTRLNQLKTVDVSNNNLSPPLPPFASNVNLKISGNPLLGAHGKKQKTFILIKLLTPLGAFLASIFSIFILVKVIKRRKHHIKQQKEEQQLENSQQLLPDNPVRFTYEVLKAATSNFNEQLKLGSGGFGSVFEGSLTGGNRVAVKRLDRFNQGRKEFLAEVRTMGSIQHLNLVRLVGFCAEKTHRLLVYEYMSNGSLDNWIFHNNSRRRLNWDIRKRIIVDIAKGLAYLHEGCIKRIAHLDVKPQNVLLDEDFNAKLSDFGLAKLIDRDQSHVMTQMRGTRGYLAPEWLDRKITEKADVYSYGVLVLEVVFERKNLDSSPPEESDNRLIYIVQKKAEASQLSDMLNNCSEDMQQNGQEVEKTIKLALWCLNLDPKRRPSMSMVVKILEGAVNMDFVSDHDILSSPMGENATREDITQVSDCHLSGPR